MPDKAVTNDGHAILFTEVYQGVCRCKVIPVFLRMDDLAFHAVLRDDRVEVMFGNGNGSSVFAGDLPLVQRRTDEKFIAEGCFQ